MITLPSDYVSGNYECKKLWTQEKLSEKAEIASDYLCRIELARKHPSLRVLLLIANALDTTADDLLADMQKRTCLLQKIK